MFAYINPAKMLTLDAFDKETIKKARRKKLMEFDLSDDNALIIDAKKISKNDFMYLTEALEDEKTVQYFLALYKELPKLDDFLTTGNLDFFEHFEPNKLFEDKDFLVFIAPYYVQQYALAILAGYQNAKNEQLNLVLRGLPLVWADSYEQVFKKTNDAIKAQFEQMAVFMSQLSANNNSRIVAELKNLVRIENLNLLPAYFQSIRNNIGQGLASIGIAIANEFNEFALSLELLELAHNVATNGAVEAYISKNHSGLKLFVDGLASKKTSQEAETMRIAEASAKAAQEQADKILKAKIATNAAFLAKVEREKQQQKAREENEAAALAVRQREAERQKKIAEAEAKKEAEEQKKIEEAEEAKKQAKAQKLTEAEPIKVKITAEAAILRALPQKVAQPQQAKWIIPIARILTVAALILIPLVIIIWQFGNTNTTDSNNTLALEETDTNQYQSDKTTVSKVADDKTAPNKASAVNPPINEIYVAWVDDVRMRATPDLEAEAIYRIPEGAQVVGLGDYSSNKVEVELRGEKINAGFVKVRYAPADIEGWVHLAALKTKNNAYNIKAYKTIDENNFDFGIEMVFVQGGSFNMGCDGVKDCNALFFDRYPNKHKVNVSSFYIGKYEVTQKQWRAVMGNNPSYFRGYNCENCPIENISWNDAQKFIKKLNESTGKKYRLPTEAEWEFAARGGNNSKNYIYSGSNDPQKIGWVCPKNAKIDDLFDDYGNPDVPTQKVGQKSPNELGLYDMTGNVIEFCLDLYDENYYANSPPYNPIGPKKGSKRVARGGSFVRNIESIHVADRDYVEPNQADGLHGFRLMHAP